VDSAGSRYVQVAGFCEDGNEPSGFVNPGGGGDFLTRRGTVSSSTRTLLRGSSVVSHETRWDSSEGCDRS
jgi:hypothetical protein